jgi:hypothetical protein
MFDAVGRGGWVRGMETPLYSLLSVFSLAFIFPLSTHFLVFCLLGGKFVIYLRYTNNIFFMEIYDQLRLLRKQHGISLSELSGCVGRSASWLSKVERGLIDLTVSDLRFMLRYMGYSLHVSFSFVD